MDLHKEIRSAYRNIRVPETVTERLKTELYQKDFRDFQEFPEENSEIFQVEEVPRIPVLKYCSIIAACLVICVGVGFSMSDLLTERSSDRLNPAQSVNVPAVGTRTETRTESGSASEFVRQRSVQETESTEEEAEITEAVAQATARQYNSE